MLGASAGKEFLADRCLLEQRQVLMQQLAWGRALLEAPRRGLGNGDGPPEFVSRWERAEVVGAWPCPSSG